jgi:hypothetical protein
VQSDVAIHDHGVDQSLSAINPELVKGGTAGVLVSAAVDVSASTAARYFLEPVNRATAA